MTDLDPSFPSDSNVVAVFQEELARAAERPDMLGSDPALWPRFAGYYHGLGRLPRRVRRTLQRQWRRSLGGLALLLALGQAPALAATINVDGGNCTLVDAITAANNDGFAGGCTAGSGADTLVLSPGSIHTLTAVDNSPYGYGPSGLPVIASAITIQGNGSTIKRDSSAPPFRILLVERFNGNLSLQHTIVSGGKAATVAGTFNSRPGTGGGLLNFGILTLTGCVVSGNSAGVTGGGINNYGSLTLTDSTVSGNLAGRGGGVRSNSGSSTLSGTVTLTDSIVSGNSAGSGGGLYNDGTLTLTDSTVSGNSAFLDGGGLYNDASGTLTLTRSTVSGNSLGDPSGCCLYNGGGGLNNNGTLTLTDSTVSGNQTNVSGGGVFNNGNLTLRHSTVSGNLAKLGGGLYNRSYNRLTLIQTLISGNYASQGLEVVGKGVFHANNFNLFGRSGSAGVQGFTPGVTDIVPTQPLVGILDAVLRNNGGRTNTHALVRGSPAVDVVPVANCATTVDQRGVPRPQDGDQDSVAECDIGAVEGVPPLPLPPTPPPPPAPPPPPPGDGDVEVSNPARPIPCAGSVCNVRVDCNLAENSGTQCVNRIDLFVHAAAARLSEDGLTKAQRRIRFAFGVANVPPAQTAKVKLRLTKKGKGIVKRKRGKTLKGVLEIRNGAGTAVSSTPIRIRLR